MTNADSLPPPLDGEVTRHADGSAVMTTAQEEAYLNRTGGLPQTDFDASDVVWRQSGPEEDPSAELRACVGILGVDAILEAHAVVYRLGDGTTASEPPDEASTMEFANPAYDADDAWRAHAMEGHAETVMVAGRRYALFMSPACG